jgi:cytochrome c oxidase subunit 4
MAGHVTSPKASTVVFVLLLVLLVVTVVAAKIEHAQLSLAIALLIASVKAVLIIIYFMNVRFADTVTRLAAVAGFLALLLLLTLLLADYATRPPRAAQGQALGKNSSPHAPRGVQRHAERGGYYDSPRH